MSENGFGSLFDGTVVVGVGGGVVELLIGMRLTGLGSAFGGIIF
jgi:hypothetical protein